jgi:hypothetical protein
MSPAFQETLQGNEMLLNAQGEWMRIAPENQYQLYQKSGTTTQSRSNTKIQSNSSTHTMSLTRCDMMTAGSALKGNK